MYRMSIDQGERAIYIEGALALAELPAAMQAGMVGGSSTVECGPGTDVRHGHFVPTAREMYCLLRSEWVDAESGARHWAQLVVYREQDKAHVRLETKLHGSEKEPYWRVFLNGVQKSYDILAVLK